MLSADQAGPSSPLVTRGAVVAFCAAILLSTPQPSYAWWGWLEKMSGPGPYTGLLFESRLVCFGPASPTESMAFRLAEAQTRLLLDVKTTLTDPEFRARLAGAADAWQHALSPATAGFASGVRSTNTQGVNSSIFFDGIRRLQDRSLARAQAAEFARQVTDSIDETRKATVRLTTIGTLWSACGSAKERRVSIDLSLDVWRTDGEEQFADDKPVRFITLMPALTYRVFANRNHDVLDVGVAAGRYWFSSEGFDAFDGWVLQPIRLGVHFPSAWQDLPHSDFRRWLSPLTVRGAITVVPAGFDAGAFGKGEASQRRIPAEYLPTVAVFFNVTSLLP